MDIGGTFTDCVLVDEDGNVAAAKALSTHESGVAEGFFNSIEAAAKQFGYRENEVFEDIVRIGHGTTVATNAVVEDQGAKTGLITTKGYQDTVEMMRGSGRATGEPPENVFKIASVDKPDPIVPSELTYGIPERVDSDGNVVVPLDEESTRDTIQQLIDEGVEAIAISLIWSFNHPEHELRVKEIIQEEAPEIYVSCSHNVSPTLGEYERTVATCINSMVGPEVSSYIDSTITELIEEYGYTQPLLMSQANGGNTAASLAAETPVTLIGSGPVGGISGALKLIDELDEPNIIATDMGGTSFEFGLINDGDPLVENNPVIQKYRYRLPKLDIKSIGAGGGSIAWIEESSDSLRVGPESAGADPGPACYNRGGKEPTVTDANLLLGYIDPDVTFGGDFQPRVDLAEEAIETLADQLGLSVLETAKGIFDITNAKMANLMENEVIGRGFDPRDFVVISYGGAGPLHASAYADQLDIGKVLIPGRVSPEFSAYGISQTDIRHQTERQVNMVEPFDSDEIQDKFEELEAHGRELLKETTLGQNDIQFSRVASVQYQGQLNEIEMTIPSGDLDQSDIEDFIRRFETKYEQRYSATARLPQAELEIVTLRSDAEGLVDKFDRSTDPMGSSDPPKEAKKQSRQVYLDKEPSQVDVSVYNGMELHPGNELEGPVIIDMPDTGIVAQDKQSVLVNEYNDFEIKL